jgi:hypothetical protein
MPGWVEHHPDIFLLLVVGQERASPNNPNLAVLSAAASKSVFRFKGFTPALVGTLVSIWSVSRAAGMVKRMLH